MPRALGELGGALLRRRTAPPQLCVPHTPRSTARLLKLQGMLAAAGKPRGGNEEEGAAGQEK